MSDQVVALIASDFTPISLYLELEPGRFADLEVAARSMLAFAGAIRDLAFVADPSLDVRIELESGSDGSLNFNAFIRSIKPKDLLSKKNLIAVAFTAISWFHKEIGDFAFQSIAGKLTETHSEQHMSQEDMDAIAKKTADLIQKGVAKDKVQSVYRALRAPFKTFDTKLVGRLTNMQGW